MQAADTAALLLLFTPCANSNDLFAEGWEKLTK